MRHLAEEKPVPKSEVVETNNWLQLEIIFVLSLPFNDN
jgi:hypothetical protein